SHPRSVPRSSSTGRQPARSRADMTGDLFGPPPGRHRPVTPARQPAPSLLHTAKAQAAAINSEWSHDRNDVLTVGAVNMIAKNLLESALPPMWIQGEVNGWKRQGTTGHCYFAIRDAHAQIRCVMFRADAQQLPTDPADGMEVRILGTLTLYEKRGEYQCVVRDLEAKGAGGLWRVAFDKLKTKLEAEGLLAPERKRAMPMHPRTIGVVTSPVGAALHDILQVVRRRAPWTRIVFSPARVQGEGAARDIARALNMFCEQKDVELVIVGRGGGGTEDLWAFNEEAVARAIAGCPVPVISAVGHETDITIADLIADLRAPTPSAAAEHAVPDGTMIRRDLDAAESRLRHALRRGVSVRRDRVIQVRERMETAMREIIVHEKRQLVHMGGKLDALSPLGALLRGFAVPRSPQKRVLRRVADFHNGDLFTLRVTDGTIEARVTGTAADGAAKKDIFE
ncbi:MAG: exodeoxyribonuclease VII large subunit, partial [Longimicrobiales bacterium]